MKRLTPFFFVFLSFATASAQPGKVNTTGDNSPAVIAKNFSATYGVRADAIEAILWIYEAKGYDAERRKRATEQIVREYAQSPERKQKADELTAASRRNMGIADAPEIANALEWDLFARSHYLSTTGDNSPAIVAKGDVNIWYGIPPKTLRALSEVLEKNQADLSNFETLLAEQVKKYEELKTELQTYGSQEEIYRQAEALLEEGRLEEAEQLIESDFEASMKRQAYKGYIYGKTKELLLKYSEAAKGYKNAVDNDEGNSTYHLYYAYNENTLAHYDKAIRHYEIALGIDTLSGGSDERLATLLNNLGLAWDSKGEYDKAIDYYEKALQIDLNAFGGQHPKVATRYNNLGSAWDSKGEYDKAIDYYEKALQIDLNAFGGQHPKVARVYNNLGSAWDSKGEYDKAIDYYEKALQIDLNALGDQHPKVATRYNNLGSAWDSKGEYDKAIDYYEKALQIDLNAFGGQHPNVATSYNNLGSAWHSKGEYDKAIDYYEKALQIDLNAFGGQHPNVAREYNNLGEAWRVKGDYDKAIDDFEKALQILLNAFGGQHPNVATSYNNLGSAWYSKGDYDKAIDYFEKALQIDLNAFGGQHPNVAISYNNLGGAWRAKGEYDKAIDYYEKALQIDLNAFGGQHPNVARVYNNLGEAWRAKGEYDKAIDYFEKALQIDLNAFGGQHPNVASRYNNLGSAWDSKGEYDKAIDYYEKALQINMKAFGENHPEVATNYNNLGGAWKAKGEYDKAIDYYKKCQAIWDLFFEPTHPYQKTVAKNLSLAASSRGMELFSKEKYREALGYFQRALENAQKANDAVFSLTCLSNIGSSQKYLQQYEEGLQNLDAGFQLAAQINQAIDQIIKEQLTPEMLNQPEVQAEIAELRNLSLIRRMRYHKVGCLKGLKRDKEADALAKQLWEDCVKEGDTRNIEDLRKEGYDFGR
jgi:tetratricopeptide (TPR) repeat protein